MKRLQTGALIGIAIFQGTLCGETPVGQAGDPAHWRFIGVHSFAPAAIQGQLENDFYVQSAADPRAPLDEFLARIQQRLEQGYRFCGFPEATVAVGSKPTSGQLTLTVVEGIRLRAGRVIVDELPAELRAAVIHRLTEKHIADPDARPTYKDDGAVLHWVDAADDSIDPVDGCWTTDEPLHWDLRRRQVLRKEVQQALADSGYLEARFTLALERAGETADLRVHLDDLGPPAKIDDIIVLDGSRHATEDVCRFLNLRPGAVVTRALRYDMRRRLLESGRFTEAEIRTEARPEGLALRIAVKDTPFSPRLDWELSAEARALLRCRDWLIRQVRAGKEIVVDWPDRPHTPRLIVSRDGLLLVFHQDDSMTHALQISSHSLRMWDAELGQHLTSSRHRCAVEITIGLVVDGEDLGHPAAYTTEIGLHTIDQDAENRDPLLQLNTQFSPAFFVAMAHVPGCRFDRSGSQLTVQFPKHRVTLDEGTGELVDWVTRLDDGSIRERVSVTEGQWNASLEAITCGQAGMPPIDTANTPITATIDFLLNGTLPYLLAQRASGDDRLLRQIEMARRLVRCGILRPLDVLFTWEPQRHGTRDSFAFCLPPGTEAETETAVIQSAMHISSYLYPANSWPWTLVRQVAFLRQNRGNDAIPIINSTLRNESCGPLAHWFVAEVLAQHHPRLAGDIAIRARERFEAEDFRRDLEALVPQRAEVYLPFLRVIARLTAEELQHISQQWPELHGLVQQLASIAHDEKPAAEMRAAVLAALVQHWDPLLRDRLATRLKQLAQLPIPKSTDAGIQVAGTLLVP